MRDAGGISGYGGLIERPAAPSDPRTPPCKTSKRWSKAELSQLKVLCDQNLSDHEIAKRLSRSRKAVRTMILRQGGKHIREATRAWTAAEAELALSMHSQGASCAAIATALPERTELAIFRKMSLMVGAAPFAAARRPRTATPAPLPEITAAPLPPVAAAPPPPVAAAPPPPVAAAPALPVAAAPALPVAAAPAPPAEPAPPRMPAAANQPGRPPWHGRTMAGIPCTPASVDTMVRWLRSRDFVVLKKKNGWRVDQHELHSDLALVDFVNVRRERMRMPIFMLAASEPESNAFYIAG